MRQKAISLVLVAFVVIGFAGAFWYNKSQTALSGMQGRLTEELTKALGSEVVVGNLELASVNKIVLYHVAVRDSHGDLLAASSKITAVFDPLALLSGTVSSAAVKELTLEAPEIYLTRQSDGRWNIDDLLDHTRSGESTFNGKIAVRDGAVTVKTPEGQWVLTAINGGFDFAAKPDILIKMTAAYNGAPGELSGRFSQEGSSGFDLKMAGFALADLKPLIPVQSGIQLAEGKISNLELTLRRDHGNVTYAGEARFDDVAMDVAAVPVREGRGLVTFTDKGVYFFGSAAKVYNQPVQLRGQIRTDTLEPVLSLTVSGSQVDVSAAVPAAPVAGPVSFTATVTGTFSKPAVYGEVRLEQGEIAGYAAHGAVARFDYSDSVLNISRFDADMFGGRVALAGTVDTRTQHFHLDGRGRGVDVDQVPQLAGQISGRGDVDVVFDGTGALAGADASVNAKMGSGTLAGISFTSLTAGISKTGGHIDVNYLTLGFGSGVLTGRGTIDNDQVNLTVFGQGVPLANLAAAAPGLILEGTADFEGTVSGPAADPRLTAKVTAYNGQAFYQPFTLAQGRILASKERLELAEMNVTNGVSRHQVRGSIGLTGEHLTDVTIVSSRARAEDIVKLILPGERLTGNVDNEVRISGPAARLTAEGRVKLTEGSFRGQLIARAEGSYRRHDGVTELKDFTVNSLNTQIKLAGTIAADGGLDFDVTAKDIDIAALSFSYPYPVAGKVNFSGQLKGTTVNPVFNGEVSAGSLRLNNQELQAVTGKIAIDGQQIDVPVFAFSQRGGQFSFAGGINTGSQEIYGSLNAENGSVAAVLDMLNIPAQDVDGRLDGQVVVRGTLAKPSIGLTGTLTKGKIKNYPLDHIDVDIALENDVLTINRFYAKQGSGVLAVQGSAALHGPLNLEIGGRGIDAGLLTTWFDSSIDTKGKLNFAAQVTGSAASPHAAVSLEISGGGVGNATFDSLYGLFVLDNDSIAVNQLMFIKGPYRASVYGTVPLAALTKTGRAAATTADQMDLKVKLDQANLSILPLLTKEVSWAAGETTGEITISGTLAQPLLRGGFAVKNGTVKLASLADPIQNVGVDIQFEGDKITVKTFDGQLGAGNYRLTGGATLHGLTLEDYNLLLVLDKLAINHKYFKGPLNGTLVLSTNAGKPTLSGKMIVENTTANIPFIPEFKATGLDVGLDFELLLRNKVRLFNPYMYDLMVEGRVKFAGSTQAPAVSGRISAIRGTVSYLRTQFKVDSGSAEFIQFGSLVPVIRLNAETTLENTKITLNVDGPANAMDFRLSSEPAMSKQEILTLLTLRSRYFEKTSASVNPRDSGLGRDQLVGLLDAGMQMRFLTEAESVFRNAFGLDDFRLVRGTTPADILVPMQDLSITDQQAYSLSFSKYINERLMLTYTTGVDHQGHTVSFRYDLSRRVSFTGLQDEQNRIRLGVETRFHF